MRAANMMRANIEALLAARRDSQTALAFALGHDKSWINKFLKGKRQIQLKDLDRIADFFGIETYRLFQPGIAINSERRSGVDRRKGRERRISQAQRNMISVATEIDRIRPRHQLPPPPKPRKE